MWSWRKRRGNSFCSARKALVKSSAPFLFSRGIRVHPPVVDGRSAIQTSLPASRWQGRKLAEIIPIHGTPEEPDRAEFDGKVLLVLQQLLAIPHGRLPRERVARPGPLANLLRRHRQDHRRVPRSVSQPSPGACGLRLPGPDWLYPMSRLPKECLGRVSNAIGRARIGGLNPQSPARFTNWRVRGRFRRRWGGRFSSAQVIVRWMCNQRCTGS